MAGYIGSKAVSLSTTSADVTGDAEIGGDLTVDTNTLYVDSTNNRVGIGTATTSRKLNIQGDQGVRLFNDAANSYLDIDHGTDGSIIKQSVSTKDILFRGGTASGQLVFETGGSEAARIDSSGNLLVGQSSSTAPASGNVIGAAISPLGYISTNRTSVSAEFGTQGPGDIVVFRDSGSIVGSIGAQSGNLSIKGGGDVFVVSSGGEGFRTGTLSASAGAIVPVANNADSDNTNDIGVASVRWDDVYATNGTIQTSDRNEKQQIASLTDAEITAAKAISKLFKTFKWNDSVAEKGDAARTHTGVIAQDVEQAMTYAGLNAGDYAFFISTTWWETQTDVPAVEADEENGVEAQEAYTRTDTYETLEEAPEGATERNRKGIRYPQLLSFIGAATEQRLASIETRLDALEANE